MLMKWVNKWKWGVLSIALLVFIWQIASLMVPSVVLPSPFRVLDALIKLTLDGTIPKAVMETIAPLFIAFLLAIVVGAAVGLWIGISKRVAKVLDPWIYISWSTPDIALLPLIIVWFGIGMKAQVVFVFLAAVFPVIMNTKTGARNVEANLVEVASSLGSNRWELMTNVVIPSALPHMMAGFRIAIGRCVVAVIISQLFVSAQGIGYLLQFYGDTLQLAKYFAPLIITALIGVLLNALADYTEKRIVRWKPESF